MAVAATVAFVAGFYAGLVGLLMVYGFDGIGGAPFELVTVTSGGVLAGIAASLVSPFAFSRVAPAVTLSTVVATGAAGLFLLAIDADYGLAIGVGGAIALIVAATASVRFGARSR
jgi:hypothetical protein